MSARPMLWATPEMTRLNVPDLRGLEERILILAPARRDAPTVAEILDHAGFIPKICENMIALCQAFEHGVAGAAVVAEEALGREQRILRDCLERQPPWSDLPVVLVAVGPSRPGHQGWAMSRVAELGNATLLERPLRSATLVSTLRSALRARRRQYQVRDYLRERERSEERLRAQETELRQLNETLEQRIADAIADRQKAEAALQHAQKMEAIGQLTGEVAHDFNNLLSAVLGNLELLDIRIGSNEGSQRLVLGARRAAERGARLTQQLLAFARKQHLRPEPVDVNAAVADMDDLLCRTIGVNVRLRTVLQPNLWPALADPSQIELVILNLAINARDAMPLGGSLVIETANVPASSPERPLDLAPGDFVRIIVADTGTGMSEDVLARAFEPFFSTKEIGKGTGLGLAQVYGVAKQSGGDVRIRSRLGEGTTVEFYLPRSGRSAAIRAVEQAPQTVTKPTKTTVVLVEDDPDVREFVANGLESLGYTVRTATGARLALDLINSATTKVDLLVVDLAMPEITGPDLARAARAQRPDLPIVFITGYAEQMLAGELELGDALVKKPFKLAELAHAIEAAREAKTSSSASGTNVLPLRAPTTTSAPGSSVC
jgi:signal transduction histidine kinase/CheY-like chemotaxis protein